MKAKNGLKIKDTYKYEYFSKHFCLFPAAQLLHRKIHNISTAVVWVVKSKGRQQKPTAPTAARLIGCGGRAAAAAAAAAVVVGTHGVDFFSAVFLARDNGAPTARCLSHKNISTQQSACCCYRIGQNKRWQRQEPPTNGGRLVVQQLLSSRLTVEITLTTAAACCSL